MKGEKEVRDFLSLVDKMNKKQLLILNASLIFAMIPPEHPVNAKIVKLAQLIKGKY